MEVSWKVQTRFIKKYVTTGQLRTNIVSGTNLETAGISRGTKTGTSMLCEINKKVLDGWLELFITFRSNILDGKTNPASGTILPKKIGFAIRNIGYSLKVISYFLWYSTNRHFGLWYKMSQRLI